MHESLGGSEIKTIEHTFNVTPTNISRVIIDKNKGYSTKYLQLINNDKHRATRKRSFENEIVCLTKGVGGRIEGTCIFFIPYEDIQLDHIGDVKYTCIVVAYHHPKEKPSHT